MHTDIAQLVSVALYSPKPDESVAFFYEMLGMEISRWGRLSKCGNGKRKRNRADNGLHLKISDSLKSKQRSSFSRASEGEWQSQG